MGTACQVKNLSRSQMAAWGEELCSMTMKKVKRKMIVQVMKMGKVVSHWMYRRIVMKRSPSILMLKNTREVLHCMKMCMCLLCFAILAMINSLNSWLFIFHNHFISLSPPQVSNRNWWVVWWSFGNWDFVLQMFSSETSKYAFWGLPLVSFFVSSCPTCQSWSRNPPCV